MNWCLGRITWNHHGSVVLRCYHYPGSDEGPVMYIDLLSNIASAWLKFVHCLYYCECHVLSQGVGVSAAGQTEYTAYAAV
jgi:hypothetical protein